MFTAWHAEQRPHPAARRIDPRVLDPDAEPAWVSLFWPDRDALPLSDDPAVQQARRTALSLPSPRAVTTATADSTHCTGSLWVTDTAARAADDPFRLLGRTRLVEVGRLVRTGGEPGRSRHRALCRRAVALRALLTTD